MGISYGDLQWWGYLHIEGSIHVKRYFGDPMDISEARASPFVRKLVAPFGAPSIEDARAHITELLKEEE